jgi:hypothetical protein
MGVRHAAPRTALTKWLDGLAIPLGFASLVLSQLRPNFVWWLLLALAVGRIGFSLVYRWNAQRVEAQWREQHPRPDSD